MSSKHILVVLFLGLSTIMCLAFKQPVEPSSPSTQAKAVATAIATTPFATMMKVISHKRCVNCHPAGNRPRQGEDSHIHYFNVQRGEDGHGLAAVQCSTCHQAENNLISGVPGAPHWHLAPRSMGWEGMTTIEIATAMVDPARNGGRSIADIEKHLTEDQLVLWAFEPGLKANGETREMPPVSKAEFIQAVKDWVAAGAPIPSQY